jgi:protein SHQ1
MPITPKFKVEQDDDFVIIRIHVPHIRVSASEILAEDNEFSFYCKPYLLKLTFPGLFHEDEEKYNAQYNPDDDNGTLTVKLMKRSPGEHFPDLDLISTLMQIRKVTKLEERLDSEGGVEVLHSENFIGDDESKGLIEDEEPTTESPQTLHLSTRYSYGFNNQYTSVLTNLREQMLDMLEIEDPDVIHPKNRRYLRIKQENKLFDPNRYLGDLFGSEEDEIYQEALAFEPFWIQQWNIYFTKEKKYKLQSETERSENMDLVKKRWREESFEEIGGLSEKEQDLLLNSIKRKEYLIKSGSQKEFNLLLGLADILFAFCYDLRVTTGDFNVESPSNITRLSSVLSWLDSYQYPVDDTASVIKFNMRRLVVYPYLRVWKFGRKVLVDVVKLFLLGKRSLLKSLLQLRDLLEHADTHYLLNKIFIDDYCCWIQTVDDEVISKFGIDYNNAKNAFEKQSKNGKICMGFFLDKIESWAEEEDLEGDESIPKEYLLYDSLIASHELLSYLNVTQFTMTVQDGVEDQDNALQLLTSEEIPSSTPLSSVLPHTSTTTPVPLPLSTPTPNTRAERGPLIQVLSSTEFDCSTSNEESNPSQKQEGRIKN